MKILLDVPFTSARDHMAHHAGATSDTARYFFELHARFPQFANLPHRLIAQLRRVRSQYDPILHILRLCAYREVGGRDTQFLSAGVPEYQTWRDRANLSFIQETVRRIAVVAIRAKPSALPYPTSPRRLFHVDLNSKREFHMEIIHPATRGVAASTYTCNLQVEKPTYTPPVPIRDGVCRRESSLLPPQRPCRRHCWIDGLDHCLLCGYGGDPHAHCYGEIHFACSWPEPMEWQREREGSR